ncbi:hypothetical protein N431DRAFT_196368 [Stipitochalara longipes BDJ]|nr:hypothetical protein N431DRAFT_196368 [Stipitochalara longipes BDJ]
MRSDFCPRTRIRAYFRSQHRLRQRAGRTVHGWARHLLLLPDTRMFARAERTAHQVVCAVTALILLIGSPYSITLLTDGNGSLAPPANTGRDSWGTEPKEGGTTPSETMHICFGKLIGGTDRGDILVIGEQYAPV